LPQLSSGPLAALPIRDTPMNLTTKSILAGVAIFAASVFDSCSTPTSDMPNPTLYTKLNVVRSDGTGHLVLADGGWETIPTDSSIIFDNGNFKLFKVNYDGSDLTQLYPNIPWGDHSLSPNGDKIFLASSYYYPGGYLGEFYLMNLDGSGLLKLSPTKAIYAWSRISPQLDKIVFYRAGGIGIINADGSGLRFVRTKTDSSYCSFAEFVDEDNIIYFETLNSIQSFRLFKLTTLQDSFVGMNSGGFPAFSRSVVGSNLLIANLDTLKSFNINTGQVSILGLGWCASFSSDGSQIVAYQGATIYIMDSSGHNQHTIYSEQDPAKSISNPLFSPDDKYVVFQTSWSVY
jgi:Tol biopolymer transport system component